MTTAWDALEGLDAQIGASGPPAHVKAWVRAMAPHAIALEREIGMLPIIGLAQGALESNWGRSRLATTANNYFGLTAGGPSAKTPHWGGRTYKATTGLTFRVYERPALCWRDYGHFLTRFKSYTSVRPHFKSFAGYVEAISKSKYISEANGDDRGLYKAGIARCAKSILQVEGFDQGGTSGGSGIITLGLATVAGYFIYQRL
jgi:Mannosyl-glycoprotein endo-beta-N-acetylglucosaminidase